MSITDDLRYWLPVSLQTLEDEPVCRWVYTGGLRFTEPFFLETMTHTRRFIENNRRYRSFSGLQPVRDWGEAMGGPPPAAFIFHVSRCGSTLLSQLMALSPEHTVLSEVPFLDEVLRVSYRHPDITEEERKRIFRAALYLYGTAGGGGEVFVKTDSWHIFFYPLLRALYPDTPFILLYREPAAILRSQQKKRGMHAVSGIIEPQLFGWAPGEMQGLALDDYLARVIERYYETFLDIAAKDPRALLVNYSEGMAAIAKKMYAFMGKPMTAAEAEQMEERGRFHAKRPEEVFSESPVLPPLNEQWSRAGTLYEELEALRVSAPQLRKHVTA